MIRRVLGIDPGGTTGVCLVKLTDQGFTPIKWEEIPDSDCMDAYTKLLVQIRSQDPEAVALETVIVQGVLNEAKVRQIRAYERAVLAAARVSGGFYTLLQHVTPDERRARTAKLVIPQALKGASVHVRDAYRLAVCVLQKALEEHEKTAKGSVQQKAQEPPQGAQKPKNAVPAVPPEPEKQEVNPPADPQPETHKAGSSGSATPALRVARFRPGKAGGAGNGPLAEGK